MHDAFSSTRLPKWRVVDALVEVLSSKTPGERPEEDQAVLHEVWLRAAQESDEQPGPAAPRNSAEVDPLADVMRRLLLPDVLPDFPGIELASRYLPAVNTSGGDWFDAIALPEGKLALVVGDVMGSSSLSVAFMSHMRSALRVLLEMDLPPHEALNRLDNQALRLSGDALATCLCAVYDPATRTMSVSSAGHLPPLINHGDDTFLLETDTGLPIGMGGEFSSAVTYVMPSRWTMFLMTDGTIDTRTQDIGESMYGLQARVQAAVKGSVSTPSLDQLCDAVLMGVIDGELTDDIALLAARAVE